jgi:hypothetical protein
LAAAPTASAIVDGREDRSHDYVVFVGQQIIVPGGAVNTQACTGTLVAPTIVVTAAHCSLLPPGAPPFPLCSAPGQVFCVSYSVRQGDNMRTPDAETTAKSFDVHPLFCATCDFLANHDLGVITLNAALEGPYGRLPKPDSLAKRFQNGKKTTIVGYGTDSAGAPPTSLGPRRSGRATASLYGANTNMLELPGPSKRNRAAVACNGDSGGPLLSGRTMHAVISFGDTACAGPTFAYRLDTNDARSFLAGFVDLRGHDHDVEADDEDAEDDGD